MKPSRKKLDSFASIALMLLAMVLSVAAAPLHELLEHSGETDHCASEADVCHAEQTGLPGFAPHPEDDCFQQERHQVCATCASLSQTQRGLAISGMSSMAFAVIQTAPTAWRARTFPAPTSGADLSRGPPITG